MQFVGNAGPESMDIVVYVYQQGMSRWDRMMLIITKTRLYKYTENFTTKKVNFQIKILIFFHISAQNIDCGYSLEPPRWGGSNEYPQSMF